MNESKDFNQDFSLSKEALERVKILLKDEEGSYFRTVSYTHLTLPTKA